MNQEDVEKIFADLNKAFIPERAKGMNVVVVVELLDENAYTLTIRDQKLDFSMGKTPGARLTLKATANDFLAIFQRKLDPTAAFFQGRLIVQGDMSLAMKLPGLFK